MLQCFEHFESTHPYLVFSVWKTHTFDWSVCHDAVGRLVIWLSVRLSQHVSSLAHFYDMTTNTNFLRYTFTHTCTHTWPGEIKEALKSGAWPQTVHSQKRSRGAKRQRRHTHLLNRVRKPAPPCGDASNPQHLSVKTAFTYPHRCTPPVWVSVVWAGSRLLLLGLTVRVTRPLGLAEETPHQPPKIVSL